MKPSLSSQQPGRPGGSPGGGEGLSDRGLRDPLHLRPCHDPPALHDPPEPHHHHLLLPGDQEGQEAGDQEKDEADHQDRHPCQVSLPGTGHGQEGQEDGHRCRS